MKKTLSIRMTARCTLLMLLVSLLGSVAHAGENRVFTVRSEPGESKYVFIQINNCTVNIEPGDGDRPDVKFDTGAIRVEHGTQGETHEIVISSLSGKRMGYGAAVTVYLPRTGFEMLFLEMHNGEAMLMQGLAYGQDIAANDSRISIQYPAGNTHSYSLRLVRSICDFALDGAASDYAITATVDGGQLSVPNGAMPDYQKGSTYAYTVGNGNAKITVDVGEKSNMNFLMIRRAN